jgi:AAA domain/Bifunctional DNA primase/polymerase, N-terminal
VTIDFRPPASDAPLDWWLAYADAAMATFPVGADKKPLTAHGVKDATTDKAQIRAWAEKWPHADIAWAVPETIVVVDLDCGRGSDGLSDFLAHEGVAPDVIATPTASTPRGGLHLVFAAAGEAYKNGVRVNGSAIDTRTLGGYIVLPIPGNGRAWRKPLTLPPAQAPKWLPRKPPERPPGEARPFSGKVTAAARDALNRAFGAIVLAPNGGQEAELNRQCYFIGQRVGAGELDKSEAIAVLKDAAALMPAYGAPWGDLSGKVTRAVEDGIMEPATADPATPVIFKPTAYVWRAPAEIPRRAHLYGKHYTRKFVSATYAPSGIGKSGLALVEAVAMAAGRDLLGIKPVAPLRVWYWNGEDPQDEIERRIAATCLHFNVNEQEVRSRLFYDNGRDTRIIIAAPSKNGTLIAEPVENGLIDALKGGEFDVLTLDPFVSVHKMNENDNGAMDDVTKTFARIADRANAAVELVHHTRKTGGAEVTADDGRGASSIGGTARFIRVLNRMTEDEGAKAGVDDGCHRLYFRGFDDKRTHAPPATKSDWFRLVSVPLGNGSGGPNDDQDYIGVPEPWVWPDPLENVTVANLREVQTAIAAGRFRANAQATDWAGIAVARVLRLDPTNKAHKSKISALLKMWIANGMFVVVEGVDDKRRPRDFIEVGKRAND